MARLLGGSLFAGQVGKDTSGEHILSEMRDAGVNLKFVKILDKVPTGSKIK